MYILGGKLWLSLQLVQFDVFSTILFLVFTMLSYCLFRELKSKNTLSIRLYCIFAKVFWTLFISSSLSCWSAQSSFDNFCTCSSSSSDSPSLGSLSVVQLCCIKAYIPVTNPTLCTITPINSLASSSQLHKRLYCSKRESG